MLLLIYYEAKRIAIKNYIVENTNHLLLLQKKLEKHSIGL